MSDRPQLNVRISKKKKDWVVSEKKRFRKTNDIIVEVAIGVFKQLKKSEREKLYATYQPFARSYPEV